MATFSESINQVSVRLEEDLHNANDCSRPSQEQEEEEEEESCAYNQSNGGPEASIQEALSDSCEPLISEVADSMICQATSSDGQYFSEQQISHLQESIRAEIPSEDENENNESSENSQGTGRGFCISNQLCNFDANRVLEYATIMLIYYQHFLSFQSISHT